MGSNGPAARGRLRKSGSEQPKRRGRVNSQQYLAFNPLEEQYEVSLDERADDGDFRHQAGFAGHAALHAEGCIVQFENNDRDGYPLQPRGARSGAAAERAAPAWK